MCLTPTGNNFYYCLFGVTLLWHVNCTKDVQKPVHCPCDVELYCEHVLERFQPCGPSNYSDPFHGPVGLRIQSNDFTEKVLSHQICEKLLWGFFLHQCSQLVPEELWGFVQEKKENNFQKKKRKRKRKNFYTAVDWKRMDKEIECPILKIIKNRGGTNHMLLATSGISTALTKKWYVKRCVPKSFRGSTSQKKSTLH